MTGITDLDALHEVPYSNIEGAHVTVRQEVVDPVAPISERRADTTVREGTIVGRGNGIGTYYDGEKAEVMTHSIGPAIYLDTPEDTVLEVRTDKTENELLEFEQDNG